MIVALSHCDSTIVIFVAKRTHLLSALINLIARLIVARIESPMLIAFCMNPGAGLIRWLCMESIALLFGSSAFSLPTLFARLPPRRSLRQGSNARRSAQDGPLSLLDGAVPSSACACVCGLFLGVTMFKLLLLIMGGSGFAKKAGRLAYCLLIRT